MGHLPVWAKGKQRECAVCGFWYPERDIRMIYSKNKWVCRWDLDTWMERNALQSSGAIKKTLETGDGLPIETGDGETIQIT